MSTELLKKFKKKKTTIEYRTLGVGKSAQWGGRGRTSGQESTGRGREGGMEVRSEPSNTSRHQTSIPALSEEETHEVGQRRGEGPHIPTHGQGADEAVAV